MSGEADLPVDDSAGSNAGDPGLIQRASEALESILDLEKETGRLEPGEVLRRLDPATQREVEGMLEDIHRLRRHRGAIGTLPAKGDLLGRYRLLEPIGQGSTSTVWRALDESIQRHVAVKVLLPENGLSETQLTRFKRESTIAGSVSHPAVLAVHDVGFHRGVHFIVTEYVEEGRTVTDLLADERKALPNLTPRSAARFLERIARGLGVLHAAGIIHRDLKPANILIRPSGAPVIADLGLATYRVRDALITSRSGAGTPFYRSPEQVRESGSLDERSDIFSLGVTIYELLVGRRPFDGGSTQAVNEQILHADPPTPRQVRPEIPRDLETICMHALEKDPERRYPNATALADDLNRFLKYQPITARPASAVRKLRKLARRRPVAATAILSTAAIVLISTYSWFNLEAQRKELNRNNRALARSQVAVDATLATAENLLSSLAPGSAIDRSETLALVEAMASSARDQGILRPMAAARQSLAAGNFGMRFGHTHAAVDIFLHSCNRASAARELGVEGAQDLLLRARLQHLRALRLSRFREEATRFGDAYLAELDGTEPLYLRCRFLLEVINAHSILQETSDIERIESKHGEVVAMATGLIADLREEKGAAAAHDRLALSRSLGSYLHHRHRYTEAFDVIEETFVELRDRHGLYDYRTLAAGTQLARTLNWGLLYELRETEWTRLELAQLLLPAAEEVLGPDSRTTLVTRWSLAESLLHDGRSAEALIHYRAVQAAFAKWERPDSPAMQSLETAIAVTLNSLGRCEEAEVIYRKMAAAYAEALGPEHHDAIIPRRGLAEAFRNQGRLEEAEEEFRWQLEALMRQEESIGRSPAVTTAHYLLLLSICRGRADEVRGYIDLIRDLSAGHESLETKWSFAMDERLPLTAEMIHLAQTVGFAEAAQYGEQILSTLDPGDVVDEADHHPLEMALSVRLAAGLDVPTYRWTQTPHSLIWVSLRQAGDLEGAAEYAENHRGRIWQTFRSLRRAKGSSMWLLAQALTQLQSAEEPPPLSPTEEELFRAAIGAKGAAGH